MGTLVTFLLYMSRMKSLSRIIWIILIGISYAGLNAQEPGDQIAGSWLGTLDAGGVELRIVFNLSFLENTGYKATMDSPDQGAKDIPCGEVLQNGDSIRIEVPIAAGYYKGKITSSKTITGTWHQANRDFELNLEKQDSVFVLNRPQEPKPPYPYREVEVSFENRIQHFNLGGTLTIPVGDGPFPAVLVVHENRGLNPYIEDVARRVAVEGFLAFAPDGLSPIGGYPGNDDDGKVMQKSLDRDKLFKDMLNSAIFLKGHELSNGKMGATGFCWEL